MLAYHIIQAVKYFNCIQLREFIDHRTPTSLVGRLHQPLPRMLSNIGRSCIGEWSMALAATGRQSQRRPEHHDRRARRSARIMNPLLARDFFAMQAALKFLEVSWATSPHFTVEGIEFCWIAVNENCFHMKRESKCRPA